MDERITGRKPSIASLADAAALPLTAITAWEVLFDMGWPSENSTGTLLVVGVTGGVGSVMLELADMLLPNVTVIATASDEERAAWVRSLGAEHVVDHHRGLAAQVLDIAPEGVDWVFTAHSEGQIETYARIVRPFGHIVAIDDGPRDVSPLKGKSIAWHWELMFTRPVQQTSDMIEQHRLRIPSPTSSTRVGQESHPRRPSHQSWPIPFGKRTHSSKSGRTIGKVVIHGGSRAAAGGRGDPPELASNVVPHRLGCQTA